MNDLKPDVVYDNMIKTQLKKAFQDRMKYCFGKVLTKTYIALQAAVIDLRYGYLDFVSKKIHSKTWGQQL
jgi:hypothetical protein